MTASNFRSVVRGLTVVGLLVGAALARGADLPALFKERLKSVVAVEYVTETESDRRQTITMGTVVDSAGTVILQSGSVDARAAVWQLKDFKIYLPGEGTSTVAEYLGQDAFTGWHFVRAAEKVRAQLVPITAFAAKNGAKSLALSDFVWGVGLRNKDEDFLPYLMQSHLALISSLPQRTGISQQEVAAPGLPVFDQEGAFVGIAVSSFGQTFLQLGRGRAQQVTLINIEESSAFLMADEVLPYVNRIPASVSGRPIAWLGAFGLEPLDRDVAKFLNLDTQSGAVVSEVLEGSPAEKAGLKARDIVLALDGKPVPPLKPNSVVPTYIEREVERRHPGDALVLTVLRGNQRVEVKAVLGDEPKLLREAERKYFDRVGVTVREFVFGDAVVRRVKTADQTGVVVHYVKPSSPTAAAGLREDDWVREIDGVEVKTFAAATEKLAQIEKDEDRSEFVLLVGRGNETAVLRVKLR